MKYASLFVLLLTLPAFATIAQQQSAKNFTTCTASGCSVPFPNNPHTGSLFVVWTFWQSTSTFTASVSDSLTPTPSTFVNAVGPTLQSAASTPISAEIFYAKNIQNTLNNPDTVSVAFSGSGTITSAGAVIVEYSGADQNYPLDSVSAGYSTGGNPTALLDSGTVAPANSNLLLFAGGVSDSGTANAGTGFTGIQSHNFSSGMAITEQNSSTITGNNVLQRATVCLSDVSCLAPSGNWVMQMAVFRDASWTVSNAWSPSRIGQVRHANLFPGGDIGAQINNAYADCPANGCHIKVDAGTYSFTTPILFGTLGKPAWLECDPGATVLTYTLSSGNAVTLNWGYYFTNVNVAVAHLEK